MLQKPIHYRLISQPDGKRILLPHGREYQNTDTDWTYLVTASLTARYLDLVPFDAKLRKSSMVTGMVASGILNWLLARSNAADT